MTGFFTDVGKITSLAGDFQVVSDSMKNVPGDGGYWIRFLITDPNTYFYRVTIYYGEHEILLASRTIYTSYQTAKYTENDFSNVAPEFHPMEGIIDMEQVLFDQCKYAIAEYGAAGYYVGVKYMKD